MEVAPAVLLLLCGLRVSLAGDWEFVDTNFTYLDDAIDYKDPCKAGTVHFTSSTDLYAFPVGLYIMCFDQYPASQSLITVELNDVKIAGNVGLNVGYMQKKCILLLINEQLSNN